MYLPEASVKILEENDRMMTTTEIANAINKTKYSMEKDESMVIKIEERFIHLFSLVMVAVLK